MNWQTSTEHWSLAMGTDNEACESTMSFQAPENHSQVYTNTALKTVSHSAKHHTENGAENWISE